LSLPDVWVVFATGRRYHEETLAAMAALGLPIGGEPGSRLLVLGYLDRPDAALATAEVVVTRGGAMSLAEVAARGVPAVIVPSPNVAHNEQEFNARVFERSGAACVLFERDLDRSTLEEAVTRILRDPELGQRMRRASLGLARPEAAAQLARLVLGASRRHIL